MLRLMLLAVLSLLLAGSTLPAANLDLAKAVIVPTPGLKGPEQQAVRMLIEEVGRRSWIRWETAEKLPGSGPAIVVGPAEAVAKLVDLPSPGFAGKEGYRVFVHKGNVYVAGNDPRGTLYGVGRLLRELRIFRESVLLSDDFQIASAPKTAIRGHQIGYRPKTNSYDGWTIAMWEQYVRDMIVFGINAIELIPPRSDDDADSPLFPDPPIRTLTAVSKAAAAYGIDVWLWYPALDADYSKPETVEFALKEWRAVFQAMPRLDAVFVPGGDPGHTPPKVMFPLLEKQTANLKSVHPNAQMWMSPQSFTGAQMDDFFALMKEEPKWLSGIVHGPQVRVTIPALRAAISQKYPIRDYPDITHSRTCQYPMPDWDVAFALTIGREGVNPRPTQMASIFQYAKPHTAGFITYSEGCHDDVNKTLWSALGWDDQADLHEICRQYGRYFVSPKVGDRFADGLFALEKNWSGPIRENGGIDETLKLFQEIEKDSGPREKLSWRFQQVLYRAYYDAYIRARAIHELGATDAAQAVLKDAPTLGSKAAIEKATAILDKSATVKPAPELKTRISELAEGLFQSIRSQLSVPKYHAIAVNRGANFDSIENPLSDVKWLRAELKAASELAEEKDRLERLNATVTRHDPGPGGFYDDLGNPGKQSHIVREVPWEKDPGYYRTPVSTFPRVALPPNSPRAWWNHAQTHYDSPLQMKYEKLDPQADYVLKVVYSADETRKLKLMAGEVQVHDYLFKPLQVLEFPVPRAATKDGVLNLTWTKEVGSGGPGRGCQVCEVWLIKKAK